MKRFVVFCGVLGGIALYLFTDFSSIHEAGATGGAFPYTKHGGGTVDGFTFSGVDRAVNPDFFLYYYDDPQAGAYVAGECAHCHEPHASFGGLEPPPEFGGDAGPDKYFLMKEYGASANYATLCWYCHENINYNPSLGGGAGYWGFYHGKAVYEDSSHYKSSVFSWPGTTGDPVTIFPRSSRSSLPSGNQGSCLNCHSPHGIREGGTSTAFDTTAVPTSSTNYHLAANNESVSADYLIPRQLIAWEEALCENCHDGTPAINIKGEIDKRGAYTGSGTTDGGGGSGHLVDYTALAGRHTAAEGNEVTQKASPGDLRHVECYDCHNPHVVNDVTAMPPYVSGRLQKVSGVLSDGVTAILPAQYEYEICFKCHAASASQIPFIPRVVNETNKSVQFNTINPSYHPVTGAGKNSFVPSIPGSDLDAPPNLSTSSIIYCTDCHSDESASNGGSGSNGPHGSDYPPILKRQYETIMDTIESYQNYNLCYRCHSQAGILSDVSFQKQSGGTTMSRGGHSGHLGSTVNAPCSVCHDPHGVKDDGLSGNHTHLINFDTRYVSPLPGNTFPTFTDTGTSSGSCTLVCHGQTHTNTSYP